MQYAPRALEGVTRYLRRVAPKEAARLTDPLALLRYELDAQQLWLLPPTEHTKLVAAAQTIVDRFDAARATWTTRSTADEWATARQEARVLVQQIGSTTPNAPAGARDEYMAENLKWIAEHEHARVVAWAHNGHIGHLDDGFTTMGGHLRNALGSHYVALGMAFDHGSFGARDYKNDDRLRAFTVAPMPPGSRDRFAATDCASRQPCAPMCHPVARRGCM
jgi:erythromycin esterase